MLWSPGEDGMNAKEQVAEKQREKG